MRRAPGSTDLLGPDRSAPVAIGHSTSSPASELYPAALAAPESTDLRLSAIVYADPDRPMVDVLDTVAALQKQSRLPEEVVLVVEHSPALWQRALESLPDVLVMENGLSHGLCGARNVGLTVSGGDVVIFFQGDGWADSHCLEKIEAHFSRPEVAVVTGRPELGVRAPGAAAPAGVALDGQRLTAVPSAGSCLAVRRSVLDMISQFAENGGIAHSSAECDEEFCVQVREKVPDGVVRHEPAAGVWSGTSTDAQDHVLPWHGGTADATSQPLSTDAVPPARTVAAVEAYLGAVNGYAGQRPGSSGRRLRSSWSGTADARDSLLRAGTRRLLVDLRDRGVAHAATLRTVDPRRRLEPSFLIVGAQKAGTTFLHQELLGHPQVVAALTKEIQYFSDHFGRGPEWYSGFFPATAAAARYGSVVCGEATPNYLFHPLAASRIGAALPEAKVIVLLRDPVRRAFSQYLHERRLSHEPARSFDEALSLEQGRTAGELQRLAREPGYVSYAWRHHAYRARGRYQEQLERLYEHIDPARVMVLVAEDMFAAPTATVARVVEFLNLAPWAPVHPGPNSMVSGPATMSEGARATLLEYFAPLNARLSEYLGRELPWETPT
ncbi:MAG: sulfotransferase [Mycobacteriales bacterium]